MRMHTDNFISGEDGVIKYIQYKYTSNVPHYNRFPRQLPWHPVRDINLASSRRRQWSSSQEKLAILVFDWTVSGMALGLGHFLWPTTGRCVP